MAVETFTTTDLLDEIKTLGAIPTNQNRFSNARLLRLSDNIMRTILVPIIIRAQSNFYEYDRSQSVDSSAEGYPIHKRAILQKLVNVALIDGDKRLDLNLLDEDGITNYESNQNSGFYLKRSLFILVPSDGLGWPTVRDTFLLRPGRLVETTDAAEITAISGSVLTISSGPSTWTNSNTFDLIQGSSPFDTLGIDLSASSVSTSSITLSASPSSRLAVGDWISLAGDSAIIQMPVEFHHLLAQMVANTCMRSMGDKSGAAAGEKAAKDQLDALKMTVEPRVEKEAKKIVLRSGLLRRAGR